MRRTSERAVPARRRAERPRDAIVPTISAATSSSTAVSTSSRESIASDRYGLGVEEVERGDGGQRGDDPGRTAAEGGDGDDDDHQHQRGVGGVEEGAEQWP